MGSISESIMAPIRARAQAEAQAEEERKKKLAESRQGITGQQPFQIKLNLPESVYRPTQFNLPKGPDRSKQFQLIREKAGQRAQTTRQGELDALERRFAAMGGTSSGQAIKLEQLARERLAEQEAGQMKDIDLAEQEQAAQDEQTRNLLQAQMGYQAEEAAKGRTFTGAFQQADIDFRNMLGAFERGSKLYELDLATQQQEIDRITTEFNKRIAEQTANQKPPKGGLFSQILGGLF